MGAEQQRLEGAVRQRDILVREVPPQDQEQTERRARPGFSTWLSGKRGSQTV